MFPWLFAKVLANFVLENTFPLTFTVFNMQKVPFFGGPAATTGLIDTRLYLSLYYFVLMALGDSVGRRLPAMYPCKQIRTVYGMLLLSVVMCVVGESLLFLITPIVTGIGVFIAIFGQGYIYGLSAKFIDETIPKEHTYAAYMAWCFAGDIGGIIGSSYLVNYMARSICDGRHHVYICALPQTTTLAPDAMGTTQHYGYWW